MAGLLASCGTSPQPQLALPQVAPNEARLVFYRNSNPYDGLSWTKVKLNGHTTGSSAPGTVFYRDLPPGTYHIEALSQRLYPYQSKTVVAQPGSTTFVKILADPYWGQERDWRDTTFIVAIVDPAIGQYEIGPLKLVSG
jgi:uncharacterized protein DUF2846